MLAPVPELLAEMSLTIGQLAELSGFTTTLIRAWERRHAFLQPGRLYNGHRRYDAEDLSVLLGVRALLDQGLRIGDIARRGRAELAKIGPHEAAANVEQAALVPSTEEDYLDGRHPEIAWAILEALPCAVIVSDRRGLVRWINRGVVALCGYDLAELHGLKPGSILQGPSTDPKAIEQLRTAVLNHRPCCVTLLNYHKSGDPYLAQVEVTPLRVGLNHLGFVGMARKLVSSTA